MNVILWNEREIMDITHMHFSKDLGEKKRHAYICGVQDLK